MKIAIASDLHLEFGDSYVQEEISKADADVLVLAGDIFVVEDWKKAAAYDRGLKVLEFFDYVCKRFKNVVYIMGNHEFYHGDIDNTKTIFKNTIKEYEFDNLHFLDDSSITIDGQQFFGGTMWSGLTGRNNQDWYIKQQIKDCISDFRLITIEGHPLTVDDMQTMFHLYVSRFKKYVKDGCVVISHNAPSFRCVHPKYMGSKINWLFANQCDNLISKYKPKLWIHGHMHDPVDFNIGETRIVCNPRGYERHEPRSSFWKIRTVVV